MKYPRIRFTPEAARLLSKLHPDNKKLIRGALLELRRNPFSGHDLQEELTSFKSYRSGRYRILYRINEDKNILDVYYIGHRSDVYEEFRTLLSKLA